MGNKIILKNSSVAAKVPQSGDLEYGELALNYKDGKLWYKNDSNVITQLNTGLTGTVPVANGGTGLTSIAALSVPVANTANTYTTVTASANQSIRVNAGGTAWEAYTPAAGGSGTVTSVAATVPSFLSISGSPITTSGTLAITYSGTALPVLNGGTGQTTTQDAINSLAGAVTSGQYLRGNGANVVMSAIQSADVPTLNQNTTGTAAGLSTTLAATSGGTGQTSYAVGDLLFASTTTALSKLADVATGNAIISGGVGVAPSYGKIGLTTHVSGTLPVANGGTGANTLTGILKGNGTSAVVAATAGTDYVTPTGVETLTNKTIDTLTLNKGYIEQVFALGTSGSISLNPTNGSIQTCALTGNPTFTDSLSAGQSIVLMLTNGASYVVGWPTITWVTSAGNVAPTLTAANTFVFWKVSTTLYGAVVGSYA